MPFRHRTNQTTVGIVVKEWNVNIINLSYVKMIQPKKSGGGKGRGNGEKYKCVNVLTFVGWKSTDIAQR